MLDAVALTGIGVVAPTGLGLDALWQRWLSGRDALSPFAQPQLRSRRIARYGQVPNEARVAAREAVPYKLRRFGTEPAFWAVHAVGEAIGDAAMDWDGVPEERRGLFSGQGDYTSPNFGSLQRAVSQAKGRDGALDLVLLAQEALNRRGADPSMSIKGLANNALALASLTWRCRGVGVAFVQNEAAGIAALRQALFELQQGRCDVAVVLATGSYAEALTLAELLRRGLLGEQAVAALQSFDEAASGAVLGEGAVALLLERRQDAVARGARIHGLVHAPGSYAGVRSQIELGLGEHEDQGYQGAFNEAVGAAEQPPWYGPATAVLADGRGVPALDAHEAQSLARVFDTEVAISCPRPVTGVIPAAGALLDLALASRVLADGLLPAVPGLIRPIEPQLGWARGEAALRRFEQAWCLQQGFSGFYSAVALTRAA
ncbi:beta-ketoacyl synthase N-terminal-like domain-containing protein [Chitinolyticbacter albus]|uniref:beta-ketoacyl synthase N-terminal-like domain-containing protein n=1 Tax=Chitinolyticbacter albus TaxID=2961951 RepID=UPI00210C9957|nr:beta-ketoacyl synthase N-terminal-like domain-containing protein [Chitinolyticbacter albus]